MRTSSVTDNLPARLRLQSVSGATFIDNRNWAFNGVLDGAEPANVTIAPGASPAGGYLPLSAFGIAPIGGMTDDTIVNFNTPAFSYAGETWTSLGVGSNGYLVVGGGSGPDVSVVNQNFPNPTRPNNVLAAFWTDLNPAAGGAVRIGTLTDGADTWIVVDWNAVRNFSSATTQTFQIWIGVTGDANPGAGHHLCVRPCGRRRPGLPDRRRGKPLRQSGSEPLLQRRRHGARERNAAARDEHAGHARRDARHQLHGSGPERGSVDELCAGDRGRDLLRHGDRVHERTSDGQVTCERRRPEGRRRFLAGRDRRVRRLAEEGSRPSPP